MIASPDWSTIALSLGGAAIVAVLTWILSEQSNRREFRRQKLYDLKLETYLDLLSAFDMLIDALDIVADAGIDGLSDDVRDTLKGLGIPEEQANQLGQVVTGAIAPAIRSARWGALGYVPPAQVPSPPSGAGSNGTAAPTPEAGLEEAILALAPVIAVLMEATKKFDRAYARLGLLGVPEGVRVAVAAFQRRLRKFGFAGGLQLKGLPAAEREKAISKWRKDWDKIAEELREDLLETMR